MNMLRTYIFEKSSRNEGEIFRKYAKVWMIIIFSFNLVKFVADERHNVFGI